MILQVDETEIRNVQVGSVRSVTHFRNHRASRCPSLSARSPRSPPLKTVAIFSGWRRNSSELPSTCARGMQRRGQDQHRRPAAVVDSHARSQTGCASACGSGCRELIDPWQGRYSARPGTTCQQLRPRLLPHARFHRHHYRGQLWHVIHDATGGKYFRMSPGAYALARQMEGRHTVQALWDSACQAGGEEVPTQNEMVELLSQLHSSELLHCDVTPDSAQLFDRHRKQQWAKWKQRVGNPMGMRLPLIQPDAFLTRHAPRFALAVQYLGRPALARCRDTGGRAGWPALV